MDVEEAMTRGMVIQQIVLVCSLVVMHVKIVDIYIYIEVYIAIKVYRLLLIYTLSSYIYNHVEFAFK